MKIKNKIIGDNQPPYIVAEMACAHQGKPDIAMKILNHAIDAKSDAIQFQIFNVDHLVSCKHSAFEMGKGLEISHEDWVPLMQAAAKSNVDLWVNVFDHASVAFAAKHGADALKIHSTDLSNPYMLDIVSETKLPLSLAVGGSLKEEIDFAVNYFRDKGVNDLIIMHGYQGFPTPVSDNHLQFIQTLKDTYAVPVGFQDHAAGTSEEAIWLPLMGLSAGACLIEKHLTYDEGLDDIDHQSSLSPQRFKNFVQTVREASGAIGVSEFRDLSEGEVKYRNNMKKVIVAAHDIAEGQKLVLDDLDFLRSEVMGLQAKDAEKLVGQTTKQPFEKGEVILNG